MLFKMKNKILGVAVAFCCMLPVGLTAQELTKEELRPVETLLKAYARPEVSVGRIIIDSVKTEGQKLILFANDNCSYIPFRTENVTGILHGVKEVLPERYAGYQVEVRTGGRSIEELIPRIYRPDAKSEPAFSNPCTVPLITRISNPFVPSKGLLNRHIAMWQSHGLYFEQGLARWEWQRARMFETVEDLYTQSYVLPFLVPMLENAGATVLLPRERDCNPIEVIADNDGGEAASSTYRETTGNKTWKNGDEKGFSYSKKQYVEYENPFTEGTYRQVETTDKNKETSTAEWVPNIPKEREYAVYISYKTVPGSTTDALYTIYHKDGKTSFKVNQQMGGGTWIYLGSFAFAKGKSGKVVLSNYSKNKSAVVTADAVKFGGGMGNIARRSEGDSISANTKTKDAQRVARNAYQPKLNYAYEVSGYPRFTEGARYWLQWAGFPDSVFSPTKGYDDYADDYKCRGLWVNYLAGGSKAVPDEKGLNIPVDLSFAFHSDAGTVYGDSIIGTLGIYQTAGWGGKFADGTSRYANHDLTDLVLSSIVNDVRRMYEPKWTRRGMWNKSYYEARVPRVPAMLLELLSHENFADMRYGADPRFRFTVSRAIYKGMLRFLASESNTDYVVEPLPVDHFSITLNKKNQAVLRWRAVDDSLEVTAKPDAYKVYMRIGNGDFDNGTVVKKNQYICKIPADKLCSFKVAALNKGGESFPSEILSAGIVTASKEKPVLVLNGFNRVSAPDDFDARADSLAGFLDDSDDGVPYLKDIGYVGKMKEFRRWIPWTDDDASGYGDSYADYEKDVIAGNSFDYPAVHGQAIMKAGYSFVSASVAAAVDDKLLTSDYSAADLILGKEKQTKMGRGGIAPLRYKTFSPELQQAISDYCSKGGRIFVSGSYVGTDLWANRLAKPDKADKKFATDVLKYKWREDRAARWGKIKSVVSPLGETTKTYSYYNTPNEESYVVESPDAIEPADSCAYTIFRYAENNLSAGVAFVGSAKDHYRTVVLGFPFESLKQAADRDELMKTILSFLKEGEEIK
jgi:hypothetical protein